MSRADPLAELASWAWCGDKGAGRGPRAALAERVIGWFSGSKAKTTEQPVESKVMDQRRLQWSPVASSENAVADKQVLGDALQLEVSLFHDCQVGKSK